MTAGMVTTSRPSTRNPSSGGSATETFRTKAPITEAERSIPCQSIQDLFDVGLARILVLREHGGLDLNIRTLSIR